MSQGGALRQTGVERLRVHLPIVRAVEEALPDGEEFIRPERRADCLSGGRNAARPCPWVSCRHHLAVDVGPDAVRERWPALWEDGAEPPDQPTCALDVVDALGVELERREQAGTKRVELDRATVGTYLRLSKDMVQLFEERALLRMARELRHGLTWAVDRFFMAPEGWTRRG